MGLGHHVAFGDYVRSRGGALLRAAHALTGNRADAEDLVQATLVKAYQSWSNVADPAALDTYVRRTMVNTCRGDAALLRRPVGARGGGSARGDRRDRESTVARAVAKLREDAELGADGSSWDLPATEGLLPACSRGTITVRDLTRRVGPWTAR
jgi:DNA-directed RNA polymerase specialized sigma24 family protein